MTYNIDPAGVQGVLSRVTDAGILLADTLNAVADVAVPLTAGLTSPLEEVTAAVVALMEREQTATVGMTNSIGAGVSAAVATSLAYIQGDDEMASNAVRAAEQAALDGNFDYFTTGDGRYIEPPAQQETSSSSSFSQSGEASSSQSVAAVPAASFAAAPVAQNHLAADSGMSAASAHFEATTLPAHQQQTIDPGTAQPVSPAGNDPAPPVITAGADPIRGAFFAFGSDAASETPAPASGAEPEGEPGSDFVARLREAFGPQRTGHRFGGGSNV